MDNAFLDLLKKWLSGDFRRADGERLQSTMADDEFRREAFEGFAGQSETVGEREVSAMRARFEKKYGQKKGGRTVPMTWMMAAAACGLLVFGTIWLFEKTDEKAGASRPQIAMEKPAQSVENQPVEIQSEKSGQTPTAPPSPILGEKKEDAFSKKKTYVPPGISQKPAPENQKMADFDDQSKMVAADELKKDLKETEAAPAAAPATRNDSRAEEPDNYSRAQNQQNVPRTLPSDYGANAKPMPKKPAAAPPPAAEADQLSEVVVAAKAEKATKSSKKKSAAEALPAPVTGWAGFADYVSKNKKQPVEAQLANITGTVELKFYIDREGHPIQVLVSKTLGGGCDEEAVRLLENGPRWSPVSREARVSIDF